MAWRSFFVGARTGRFSLGRSGDLWRLLVSITMHKLYRQVRRHSAECRSVDVEESLEGTSEDASIDCMAGTASFMAPEQVSRYWGPISPRTDIYGLGAVLYTLLTGQAPWQARTLPDILAQVVSAAPIASPTTLRPDITDHVSEICLRCLAKSPEDRYDTARQLSEALSAAG